MRGFSGAEIAQGGVGALDAAHFGMRNSPADLGGIARTRPLSVDCEKIAYLRPGRGPPVKAD